jgi:hypothetical protein
MQTLDLFDMTKQQLQEELQRHHHAFTNYIKGLSPKQLESAPADKWNALQQAEHLIKSVGPVNMALSLPLFILRLLFGKANRKSRSYDELVAKYQSKLQAGGRAPGRFVPGGTEKNTEVLEGKLLGLVNSLQHKINTLTEDQLDQFILPHPLLGKLTLREMIYFTIYHVQHHHRLVQNQLR